MRISTSKALVPTNAQGQLQDITTDHLVSLGTISQDFIPGRSIQAQLESLGSSTHVHPCGQVVTSPSLKSSFQVHPTAQLDSSPSLEPICQVHSPAQLLVLAKWHFVFHLLPRTQVSPPAKNKQTNKKNKQKKLRGYFTSLYLAYASSCK